MKKITKLLFLILISTIITITSCNKEKEIVPNVPTIDTDSLTLYAENWDTPYTYNDSLFVNDKYIIPTDSNSSIGGTHVISTRVKYNDRIRFTITHPTPQFFLGASLTIINYTFGDPRFRQMTYMEKVENTSRLVVNYVIVK